jgi:hypothetical protein
MSDSVTPILAPAKKRPRRVAPKIGLKLSESQEGADFSSLDVVNALHGVCVALDDCVVNQAFFDRNHTCHLAMAAKVLSSIVQERLVVP